MIFSSRCLGLGIALGITLGGVSPLYAQSSSSSTVTPVRSSLALGSQGSEVTELQSILQFLGFYLGRIDGVFSEATQQGVQRFQQAAGLPTTGQMTLADWNRLLPSAVLTSVISPGTVSPSVISQPVQPSPVPTAVTPPPPTAQSFPIPEVASQPPSGSATPPSSETPRQPVTTSASSSSPDLDTPSESEKASETLGFPLLRLGSEGTEVERLQQRLSGLGFYSGEIDGIFGEETEESVKQFQEQFELEIDGIVGRTTWETLFNPP